MGNDSSGGLFRRLQHGITPPKVTNETEMELRDSRVQLKLGLADMGQDTTGFSRVVPHFNLTPRQNRTDTIGFSRMVLQLQPSVTHILSLG